MGEYLPRTLYVPRGEQFTVMLEENCEREADNVWGQQFVIISESNGAYCDDLVKTSSSRDQSVQRFTDKPRLQGSSMHKSTL